MDVTLDLLSSTPKKPQWIGVRLDHPVLEKGPTLCMVGVSFENSHWLPWKLGNSLMATNGNFQRRPRPYKGSDPSLTLGGQGGPLSIAVS